MTDPVHAIAAQPWLLPCTDKLDLAASYLPASEAPMGGDWYDAFPVAGGLCLVIGDVAGHGVQSAATMARLRAAVRCYAGAVLCDEVLHWRLAADRREDDMCLLAARLR